MTVRIPPSTEHAGTGRLRIKGKIVTVALLTKNGPKRITNTLLIDRVKKDAYNCLFSSAAYDGVKRHRIHCRFKVHAK